MINKRTLAEIFSSLTHGRKKKIVKQTIHPKREWYIGLILFFVIVSLGSLFSMFSFSRFADVHLTLKGSEQAVESYKENTIKKAISIYTERKSTFNTFLNSRTTEEIVIPQIPITIEPQPTTTQSLPEDVSVPPSTGIEVF